MQATIGYTAFIVALLLIAHQSYRATKRYGSKRVWNAGYVTLWVVLGGTGFIRVTALQLYPEHADYIKALDDQTLNFYALPIFAFMSGPWIRFIRDVKYRGLNWSYIAAKRQTAS